MMWKSGSYWRPSPSSVISALNISDRSDGSTIECSRTIAANWRMSVADADVLQRHALVVEHQLVHVGGEPCLVDVRVSRPVEQHLEHRLLVHAREPGEQIDHLRGGAAARAARPCRSR